MIEDLNPTRVKIIPIDYPARYHTASIRSGDNDTSKQLPVNLTLVSGYLSSIPWPLDLVGFGADSNCRHLGSSQLSYRSRTESYTLKIFANDLIEFSLFVFKEDKSEISACKVAIFLYGQLLQHQFRCSTAPNLVWPERTYS